MITRDFNPDDDLVQMPMQALEDLLKNGFAYVTMLGKTIRITKDDLLFKEEEIEKFLQSEEYKKLKNHNIP